MYLLLSMTLLASPYQHEKVCQTGDPLDCRQHVVKGELVPFEGQLLTPRKAARLGVQAGECDERISLAISREKEIAGIRVQQQMDLRANDQRGYDLQVELMLKRMQLMEETLAPKWYERPPVVAVVTSIIMVGLYVTSVKTIQALK